MQVKTFVRRRYRIACRCQPPGPRSQSFRGLQSVRRFVGPLFLSKLDDPHGVSRAIALSQSNEEAGSLLRLFAKSAEIGTDRGRGARARHD